MPTHTHSSASLDTAARKLLGIRHLRAAQRDPINAILDGRDTLVVMPTGAGKSAIYSIAGALLGGITLVVSPLIALQRDQVERIDASEGLTAAELNSTLTDRERETLLDRIGEEDGLFVFLAPEQLANEQTRQQLARHPPALIAIDEAHCISEWGHDFRPDYLHLGAFIEELGHPPLVALTATAGGPVRTEIIERLGMREPAIFVHDVDRPNIHLAVERVADDDAKRDALTAFVTAHDGPGIVYAATREETEGIAAALAERDIDAHAYHAGMKPADRAAVQEAFMSGTCDVMVATIAFGMGIDKPDIRYVCHMEISESLDLYYQEIGRAGRDGKPADALLLYAPEDLDLRRFQAGVGALNADDVRPVLATIREADGPIDPADLREELGIRDSDLAKVASRLEDVGALNVAASGALNAVDTGRPLPEVAEAAADAQERMQHYARSRLEMMRQYATLDTCRRAFLLNYLGDAYDGSCGNCDCCDAGEGDGTAADRLFPLQSRVVHAAWGSGVVMHCDDDQVTALFDSVGYRTLDLDLVREKHLLRADSARH